MRAGDLTRRLTNRGHEVTWWTGRFEHQTKRHLDTSWNEIAIPGTVSRVRLLDSSGYKSNVSLARFRDHAEIAKNFREAIASEARPDVIVVSMPTPELADEVRAYAVAHDVPYIVDVRDMWPDVIIQRIRSKIMLFPSFLMRNYERMVKRALLRADSVTSITPHMLNWAQEKSDRGNRDEDKVFRLASARKPISPDEYARVKSAWAKRGFHTTTDKTIFALAGSLTDQRAMREFLAAQSLIPPEIQKRIQVVICGRGDLEGEVRAVAKRHPHVIYAGFVSRDDVQFLYDHGDYGLLMYDNTPDFKGSFPNKFGEYLMSGLPVITTIRGAIQAEYGGRGFIVNTLPRDSWIARTIAQQSQEKSGQAVRDRARLAYEQDFNADVIYEAFCDHIEEIATTA